MKRIDIRPYNGTLYFTTSKKDFLKARRRFETPFEESSLDDCGGMASDNGHGTHIVGVFDGTLSALVHEINHVVIKEMERVGIQVDVNHQEAACYLLADLFGRCEIEMRRRPLQPGTTAPSPKPSDLHFQKELKPYE